MASLLNMSGGSLLKIPPYDYEVEFLQNTGKTQYIDTGIVGGPGLKIQTTFTSRENAQDKFALGSYYPNGRIYVIYQYPIRTFGGGYGNYFNGSVPMEPNKTYEVIVEFTPSDQIITIDGVQTTSYSKPNTYQQSPYTLWMFGYNNGSSLNSNNVFECEFGHTKMWVNDLLVRDFIPVVKDSVGYMYDKVSGRLFGNAGTGDFTFENQYVEYLEATGTQYINLGEISGQYIKIEVKFQKTTDSTAEMAIVGANQGIMELYTSGNDEIGMWNGSAGSAVFNGPVMSDVDYEVVAEINANGQFISVDGNSNARTGNINSVANNPISLFVYNRTYKFTGRIFYCKIWSNDTLWRDLVPIRRGQKGYMLDKISGQIFYNAGTGDFILGPDK